jgi:glycosyltransferase involved in cell wall biosynthesis
MVPGILNNRIFKSSKIGPYSKKLLNFNPIREKVKFQNVYEEPRILRVICQRPYYTGSGINLINLTKKTAEKEFDQFIIFGQPMGESNPLADIIDEKKVLSVKFLNKFHSEKPDIPFPVAGMSDQMPYESTKFSSFDEHMLEVYLEAFAQKIKKAVSRFKPNIIHSHHLWLVSSLCRVLYPKIPIIGTCHNTGLRQMLLAPQLRDFMINPIKGIDAIAVINESQQRRVEKIYHFEKFYDQNNRFCYIGQGINTNIFHPSLTFVKNDKPEKIYKLIYVGKLNFSKGVPQLIKAFKQISQDKTIKCELILVGSGKGKEKDYIYDLAKNEKNIHFLGQIEQEELAKFFKKSDLFVLPSFYEGFPNVLLEALSCGCRAIITDLPGIKDTLEKTCGKSDVVKYLPLPEMKSIDQAKKEDLPNFIKNLKELIKEQIMICKHEKKDLEYAKKVKAEFSWETLFIKYLDKYCELLSK